MNYVYAAIGGFVGGIVICRLYYNKAISAYKYLENGVKAGVAWVEHLPSELYAKIKAAL